VKLHGFRLLVWALGGFLAFQTFAAPGALKREVPPPLIALLKSLGKLKLSVEISNETESDDDGNPVIQKRITSNFHLNESILVEFSDREKIKDEITRSLLPVLTIGHSGIDVHLNALQMSSGTLESELSFRDTASGERKYLPVLFEADRFKLVLGIEALKWSGKNLDPTLGLFEQDIDLEGECLLYSYRPEVAKEWAKINCQATIQYDSTEKKWFYRVRLLPEPLSVSTALPFGGCPQDSKKILVWMNEVYKSYENRKVVLPAMIDHPLGGDILAQGSFNHEPYREYFSNFLIRLEGDEIFLGPQNFGLVLKIPKNSWILICGDTRPDTPSLFIDVSFYKISTNFFTRNKSVKRGPIKVRWKPIRGAVDTINGATRKIPLVTDFFKFVRDFADPLQDLTISAVGGIDVDKIRLTTSGIEFTSSGKVLETLDFGLGKKIDSKAFEQFLIPGGPAPENP
jgi:hypothetical protein